VHSIIGSGIIENQKLKVHRNTKMGKTDKNV